MEKKVTDYIIVSTGSPESASQEVCSKLRQGWQLFGSLSTSNTVSGRVAYSQALVKYGECEGTAPIRELQYVQGENLAELLGKVAECLKENWNHVGSLIIAPDNKRFYQAMSR